MKVGGHVSAYVLIEIFYARFVFFPATGWVWKPFFLWFGGLAAFGFAALSRALATTPTDPWCSPHSFFQPHGLLWHTFAGVMALCIYFYWREDIGGIGRLPANMTGGISSSSGGNANTDETVWS